MAPGCEGFYDVNHNTIFSKLPRNWADFERIKTLGHEVLHASGYKHEHGKHGLITGGNYEEY